MNATRSDEDVLRSARQRGYVGGGYFNPAEDCRRVGRELPLPQVSARDRDNPTHSLSDMWAALIASIHPNEVLFGVYRRLLMTQTVLQAVHLPDIERLADFETQVATGSVERVGFYALAADEADRGLLNREHG